MVKVIFWQYFVFDPIFFLHLRDITSLLWRSWFNLEIYVQWSEVGRLAWRLVMTPRYHSLPRQKSFDTIKRSVANEEHKSIEKYSPTVASRPTALRIFPDSYLNLIIPNGERSGYLIVARFGDDYHSITVFANTFTKITNVIWEWMHGCTPIFSTRFVTTYNVIRSPFCPHFNLN